jgi:hypothetical protein
MFSRKSKTARLFLAMTTIATLGAAASAQPLESRRGQLGIDFDVSAGFAPTVCVGTVTVDGERHDIDEWVGVKPGVIDALRCAGYEVWTEGQEIVVNICDRRPQLRFDSREYRLTSHIHGDELHISLRPRHRHHSDVRTSEPALRRDDYGRTRGGGPRSYGGESEHGSRRSDAYTDRRGHNARGSGYFER